MILKNIFESVYIYRFYIKIKKNESFEENRKEYIFLVFSFTPT